jgi:hypothetical protein
MIDLSFWKEDYSATEPSLHVLEIKVHFFRPDGISMNAIIRE